MSEKNENTKQSSDRSPRQESAGPNPNTRLTRSNSFQLLQDLNQEPIPLNDIPRASSNYQRTFENLSVPLHLESFRPTNIHGVNMSNLDIAPCVIPRPRNNTYRSLRSSFPSTTTHNETPLSSNSRLVSSSLHPSSQNHSLSERIARQRQQALEISSYRAIMNEHYEDSLRRLAELNSDGHNVFDSFNPAPVILGLSKNEIDSLPTCRYDSKIEPNPEIVCVICITSFVTNDLLKILPCTHQFHKNCIDEWLARGKTCPICRQVVIA